SPPGTPHSSLSRAPRAPDLPSFPTRRSSDLLDSFIWNPSFLSFSSRSLLGIFQETFIVFLSHEGRHELKTQAVQSVFASALGARQEDPTVLRQVALVDRLIDQTSLRQPRLCQPLGHRRVEESGSRLAVQVLLLGLLAQTAHLLARELRHDHVLHGGLRAGGPADGPVVGLPALSL